MRFKPGFDPRRNLKGKPKGARNKQDSRLMLVCPNCHYKPTGKLKKWLKEKRRQANGTA